MGYKKELQKMLKIFNPPDIDWMGWLKNDINYYTFHHIEKKEDGGKNKMKNGAILTIEAHQILHYLEIFNNDLFIEWNNLFIELNRKKSPLVLDDYYKIFKLNVKTNNFMTNLDNIRIQEGKKRLLK